MLHTSTIEPGTFSVLKQLLSLPELKIFSLVGGTALSLQYGHRTSIDIDLFSTEKFEHQIIINTLKKTFANNFEYEGNYSSFGIFCFINSIKTDLVYYPHQKISDPLIEEGISMYHNSDIAAMKIQAILGRGKKKDFWDIAELLEHYDLETIIGFHKTKFPSQQLLISIPQALVYFNEAEESEDPVSLKKQTWDGVKKLIRHKVNNFLK